MALLCPSCGETQARPGPECRDAPRCAHCGSVIPGRPPVALDDTRFDDFLRQGDDPVLVDYGAEWCGPCQDMAPQFEAAAALLPELRLATVDTEASPKASVRHRIRSVPTLVLFRRGEEIARRIGTLSAREIVAWARAQSQ